MADPLPTPPAASGSSPPPGEKPRLTTRRKLLRSAIRLGTLGLVGGGYSMLIEPSWIEFRTRELTLPRLPREFDGYRITQVSDIHFDDWMTESRLGGIVAAVNRLGADAIVMTGDFVSIPATSPLVADPLTRCLSRLSAPDGVFAVLGNHDHWNNEQAVESIIRAAGLNFLCNSFLSIQRGDSRLHLAGVDDVMSGAPKLRTITDRLPSDGGAIMLAHEPDFADEVAACGRFDLQLSGHSHGGQVWLPIIGAPVLPPLGRKYPNGHYDIAGMQLYTNRGVGLLPVAGLRVRFLCWPEITTFTLRSGLAAQ